MAYEPTDEIVDNVLELMNSDESTLYSLLGTQTKSGSLGAGPDEDDASNGRRYFQFRLNNLRNGICHNNMIIKLSNEGDGGNKREIVAVLLDLLAGAMGVLPAATAIALILKTTIKSFCQDEWKM